MNDFIGLAVESMLSTFFPTCRCCGMKVRREYVRLNGESSGYIRKMILDLSCWLCGAKGKIEMDFLRTYIYDLEGPFNLNERVIQEEKRQQKKPPRTKLPRPIQDREVLLEVWEILHNPR